MSDIDFDYKLKPDSVVFDVGGFKGDFAHLIRSKWGCPVHCWEPIFVRDLKDRFASDPLVWIYDCALEDVNEDREIFVNGDSTSMYFDSQGSVKQTIKVRSITDFIVHQDLQQIDLLKLNCEGSEFRILNELVKTGFIEKVRNIAVQYHPHGHEGVDLSATHDTPSKNPHWQWLVRR